MAKEPVSERNQDKIGSGHAKAMFRQGLAELRGALYADSNVAQPTEYGVYGKETPSEVACLLPFRKMQIVLDPRAGSRGHREIQPVAARMMAGCGEDLDDVAVLELGS